MFASQREAHLTGLDPEAQNSRGLPAKIQGWTRCCRDSAVVRFQSVVHFNRREGYLCSADLAAFLFSI